MLTPNPIRKESLHAFLEAFNTKPVYDELGANAYAHEKLKQYITKQKLIDVIDGKLVAALPETWKFKADPNNEGVIYEWHQQPVKDGWREMKTTASWEIQGMQNAAARGYNGYGWYRTSFDVSPGFEGKKKVLFIGGVNNQAWIWINGKLAAATPYHEYWARWKYHDQVDISEHF